MKKIIILIVSIIIIFGGYRYYEAKNSDVLFNYGIHPFEENAVVEEINSDNREITVFIKDSDTYLESEKNPYEDKEIKLNCSKIEKEKLEQLEIFDEIVFTHVHDDPYTVLELKNCKK